MRTFLKCGFILVAWFTLSCSSNDQDCEESLLQYPNPEQIFDSNEYHQSKQDCRFPKVQTFTFMSFNESEIIGDLNTILMIGPQSFTDVNGEVIDGEITLSLIEMYQPGEVIACQLSTNGVNPLGNIEPLISEGIFYIEFTSNGQQVNIIKPVFIFIPSENSGLYLHKYNSPSCPDLLCEVLWEQQLNSEIIEEPYITAEGFVIYGYRTFFQNNKGWHSVSQYPEESQNKTMVFNKVPNGYNGSNSNVFIVYNPPSLAVGMFPAYDETNRVFNQDLILVGVNASIVFVSKQEQNFIFASQNLTVTPNKVAATLDAESLSNEEDLINNINEL